MRGSRADLEEQLIKHGHDPKHFYFYLVEPNYYLCDTSKRVRLPGEYSKTFIARHPETIICVIPSSEASDLYGLAAKYLKESIVKPITYRKTRG